MAMHEGKVNAPEFPAGLEWLNVERPLRMADLRGKVVVLDFWTYCCINCMHIIPDLKRLEAKYARELVVIGVHSAKFTQEKQTANIRSAVLRYQIEHPVINDSRMTVWQLFGARAWPTLVLIDPAGKVVGYHGGEGAFDVLDEPIAGIVEHFDSRGLIDRRAMSLRLECRAGAPTGLSFPGKVVADEGSGRLFIADSNHNRIVIASLADGKLIETVGSGRAGLDDGDFATAAFFRPQGLAVDGSMLYVADTENHAIRRVDIERKRVETIAGTGRQAPVVSSGGAGRRTDLSSPWDIVVHDGKLYIAMAGTHQLWVMDLASGHVAPHTGTGREARIDGPLRSAALSQPSGITCDGRRLYFADSEDSSIRYADIDPAGQVGTIVGGDLFDFGDRDGSGLDVRLQHPLGVAIGDNGLLYVADTYNSKIKIVDPDLRTSRTIVGRGTPGMTAGGEGAVPFNEPAGLSFAGGKLYIADTNNHAVRLLDVASGHVSTLEIGGLAPPLSESAPLGPSPAEQGPEVSPEQPSDVHTPQLPEQSLAEGVVQLRVRIGLPDRCKIAADSPSAIAVASTDESVIAAASSGSAVAPMKELHAVIALKTSPGRARLSVTAHVYYCSSDSGQCRYREYRVLVPVAVSPDGAKAIELRLE